MPFYWTNINTKYAIMNAAVPASGALVGPFFAANCARIVNFLENQQYPRNLAPSYQFFDIGMNVATVAPLGYASYLVYKYGGGLGYTDTTIALGLYAATIGTGLITVPVLNYRNVKSLALYNGLLAALAATTAFAFYKIDNISGYWAIPFSLWTMYCAGASFLDHFNQFLKIRSDVYDIRSDMRLISMLDTRFTRIDTRFTRIETRLTRIETRLTEIDNRFTEIDNRFTRIETRLTKIETDISHLCDAIRLVNNNLRAELAQLTRNVAQLQVNERSRLVYQSTQLLNYTPLATCLFIALPLQNGQQNVQQ